MTGESWLKCPTNLDTLTEAMMPDGYVEVLKIDGSKRTFRLRMHYGAIAILSFIVGVWTGYLIWHP